MSGKNVRSSIDDECFTGMKIGNKIVDRLVNTMFSMLTLYTYKFLTSWPKIAKSRLELELVLFVVKIEDDSAVATIVSINRTINLFSRLLDEQIITKRVSSEFFIRILQSSICSVHFVTTLWRQHFLTDVFSLASVYSVYGRTLKSTVFFGIQFFVWFCVHVVSVISSIHVGASFRALIW